MIGRRDRCSVLDRKSSEVRVRHKVAGSSQRLEQSPQNGRMSLCRLDRHNGRSGKPPVNKVERLGHG